MKVEKRYRARIRQSIYQKYFFYLLDAGDGLTVEKIHDKKIDVTFGNLKCFIFHEQIENF